MLLIYINLAVAVAVAAVFFLTARKKSRHLVVWPVTGFVFHFIPFIILHALLPKVWWGTAIAIGAGVAVSFLGWLLCVSKFGENYERFYTFTIPWLARVGLNSRDLDSPVLMTVDDIIDPAGLVVKLRDARDPFTNHLRKCLSSETKRLLGAYAGGRPAVELMQAIVDDLNGVIKGECVFDEQRFSLVKLSKETQRSLQTLREVEEGKKKLELKDDYVPSLNRQLLKEAYRREIAGRADVFRRIGAATLWMAAFFAVAWLVSYFLFKEDLLENTWLVRKLFGISVPKNLAKPDEGPDPLYWARAFYIAGKIFLHYLVVMVVFVFLLNHFRVGRLNLGYAFLFAYATLIGAVVGTQSFPYYSSTKLGALITFIRFSLWQLVSLMMAAAATTGLAAFATPGWLEGTWKRVRPLGRPKIFAEDVEVLVYTALILLASSLAEARLIIFYDLF